MNKSLYKQCQVQYESKGISTVWIPLDFAIKNKNIIVEKDKYSGIKARIIKVFSNIILNEEQIIINRKNKFDSIIELR